MPGPPHIVRSPALLGVTEAVRPELVDFGAKSLRSENVRAFNQGEAGTRYGFTALGNGHVDATTPVAGYKLLADRRSPVRICDGQIEAYSSKANAWQVLGRVPECGVSMIAMPSIGVSGSLSDIDATNGYIAAAWYVNDVVTGLNTYAAILDQATGATVRAPELLGGAGVAGSTLAFGVIGNTFVALRGVIAGTKIIGWALDTTSASTINTGWVAFVASVCTNWLGGLFTHSMPTQGKIAAAYANTSGGAAQLSVLTVSTTAVVATTTITSGVPNHIGLGGFDTDTLWVAWNDGVNIRVAGLNPVTITAFLATAVTLNTLGANPDAVYVAGSTVSGKARVWYNTAGVSAPGFMNGVKTLTGAATADGTTVFAPTTRMVRKPFFSGGLYYSAFTSGDAAGGAVNQQQNFIICDWTTDTYYVRPVANIAPGLATSGNSTADFGKFVAGTVAGQFYVGLGVKKSAVADSSQLALLDFADTRRWQPCAWGNSTYLSGGLPSCFDGVRVAEVGFLIRPPQPTTATGGTGITATVGWRYVCAYEEVDGDGNWHQSGISAPSASTGAVTNLTVTATTAPLSITSRLPSPTSGRATRVVFYRTLDGGVAPYYRVGTILNDPTSLSASFADAVPDVTLAANAKLYEQPGVLGTSQDKRPPPAFSCLVSYNGMLVGASGSDVWSSGQNVSGEGVWFNPVFQVPVPGDGDITSMWAMDGTLFVSKRREIYAIAGEAPSDSGASGGLGLPRRLAVDVGCIDSRSVCVTALGTFFQSDRGIEILTRAQVVQWVGQPIQDTLALFPIVTSATVVPSTSGAVVLIELAASQAAGLVTGTGRALVFDLSSNDWIGMDRRTSSTGVVDAPAQSACMIYTGSAYQYAWMTGAGVVHYENPTTYLDANGSFVVPLIETGWFNAFQNEQRVWRLSLLFQRYTAAGLKVEVAYDYGDYASVDNGVWTEIDTKGQRQLEMSPSPRGESMKFRITTTAPAVLGSGQGIAVFALALDLAAKQGPTKGTVRLDPALRR